jgi:2-alkenal reductase
MQSRFAAILAVWALALATLYVGEPYVRTWLLAAEEPRPVAERLPASDDNQLGAEIFERAAPAVVFIFSELDRVAEAGGAGSGIVWDEAGHIVTNYHVVQEARQIAVRFELGRAEPAEVVGVSPDHELAVLRVRRPAGPIPEPIPLGSVDDLRVGHTVYAIGNPFGLARTLTRGIVSALDRTLPTNGARELTGIIQTDAAINPGNSGGPLLDESGRLVGVTTAIVSASGASAGIGFAVPVDVVNRIVPQLIREGRVPRPGIGISVLDESIAARLDVDGVVVGEVRPDSPAAEAGLEGVDPRSGTLGDIILAVNGKPVRTAAELVGALEEAGIGNQAELTIARNGQEMTVAVEVTDIS